MFVGAHKEDPGPVENRRGVGEISRSCLGKIEKYLVTPPPPRPLQHMKLTCTKTSLKLADFVRVALMSAAAIY